MTDRAAARWSARLPRLPLSLALPLPLPWALVLAFASGAAAVLSFAPFGLWPAALLALLGWQAALAGRGGRGAALVGWAFGLGLLGFGVFWIRISLNEFGNMPAPVANTLMALFVALLALFYALAGWGTRWLAARAGQRLWVAPLLALPAVWVLLEWLRGWVFTGFPWLILGTSQVDGPLGGLAPVLGVYGLSLLLAVTAGLLWLALTGSTSEGWGGKWAWRRRWFPLGAIAGIWLSGLAFWRVDWTAPAGDPLRATVIQGNVEQSMKWSPDGLLPTLEVFLTLTHEALPTDLIVWPETAIPAFLHEVADGLIEPLAQTAREEGFEVVIGVPVLEPDGRYYNGLISLGSTADRYFKRHLVPFGEFLPFEKQLSPLIDWFEVPMSHFSRGRAPRPLLRVGAHPVGASICYEDVFPDEVREALPEAAYLINVSNDAWFGDSLAPHQHLQMARLRALENGRDLVRATNTGISAVIDHRGRVKGQIPAFKRAFLTLPVQPRTGTTPFTRTGSGPVVAVAVLLLAGALLLGRRQVPG